MVDADPVALRNFVNDLPKLELHAHLNGSISRDTLKELYAARPDLPPWTDDVPDSLPIIFELFDQIHAVVDNVDAVKTVTKNVIREFHDDKVIYLELRTTPRSVEGKMTKEQYLQTVVDAIQEASTTYPNIIVKLLVSVCRHHSEEDNKANLQLAINFNKTHPDVVVGVDISGNPSKGSWTELEPLAQNARDNGLKVTVHCAEQPNTVSEASDILKFKPDRIGHGVCLHPTTGGSEELWQQLVKSKIPVELCLTSNLKTQSIKAIEDHPLKYFTAGNLLFTICTDDKGVFNTSLTEEIQLAMTISEWNGPWNSGTLFWLSFRAIDFAFVNNTDRAKLRKIMKRFQAPNPSEGPNIRLDDSDLM